MQAGMINFAAGSRTTWKIYTYLMLVCVYVHINILCQARCIFLSVALKCNAIFNTTHIHTSELVLRLLQGKLEEEEEESRVLTSAEQGMRSMFHLTCFLSR